MIFSRILILLFLLSCKAEVAKVHPASSLKLQSANQRIKLQLSGRVDTTKQEVKAIVNLYENYINSSPDSIYNNPYWNQEEKAQYNDFDFSRVSLFNGLNSTQLFSIYPPFVLSVEPVGDKYQIRVLYSNSAQEAPYVSSKVWCIHKLSAVKENKDWKLENLLVEETKDWVKTKIDFIEFIYPKAHQFNKKRARHSIDFCRTIIERFHPNFNNPFKFYITNGIDRMGLLENFDFYFTGTTTGKAREGMILSAKNDEFYPHEFIHKLLPANKDRGHVIEEGLATFLGTKEDKKEYHAIMKKLADDFNKTPSYSLENILNNQVEWNGYPVAYPAGALICEVINGQQGDKGINQLIRGKSNNYKEIMSLALKILNTDEKELVSLIEQKLEAYRQTISK